MMHVSDRELEKTKKQKQSEAAARAAAEEPDDMELTLDAKAAPPLDKARGLFDERAKEKWSGINTTPSVFERGAVFRTGSDS